VNCDFRRPVLGDYFGVEPTPATVVPSGLANLSIVTNVARDPGAKPARAVAAQRALVEWARMRYDIVLLDTAPLLVTNDAVDLLAVVDIVTVVVRHGSTKSGDLERARALLERHRARVVGGIANCVDDVTSSYYYYYAPDIAKQLPQSTSSGSLPPPSGAPLAAPDASDGAVTDDPLPTPA
jgi:Mrp family chromosome partitioning ATPase